MAQPLYAGGELDSVTASGTVSENSTAGRFDSSYARCCVLVSGYAGYAQCDFIDSSGAAETVDTGQTLWWHAEVIPTNNSASVGSLLDFYGTDGFPWLAIRGAGSNTFGLYGNTGTGASPTWTLIGSTFTMSLNTRYRLDISLTLGSPHGVELFQNEASIASGTFSNASLVDIAFARCHGISTSIAFGWSQMMATEGISTVSGKCAARSAGGAGTTSDWTGAYTDINETPLSDASVLTSGSANQVSTFAYDDVTFPANLEIRSVFLASRAKNDGLTPLNFQAAARSGSTNYFSGNLNISTSFAALMARWDADPDTSVKWTQTGFNNAEFGGKSLA